MMNDVFNEMIRRGAFHAVTHIKFAQYEMQIDTIYFKSSQDFVEWCDLQHKIYEDFDRILAIQAIHRT